MAPVESGAGTKPSRRQPTFRCRIQGHAFPIGENHRCIRFFTRRALPGTCALTAACHKSRRVGTACRNGWCRVGATYPTAARFAPNKGSGDRDPDSQTPPDGNGGRSQTLSRFRGLLAPDPGIHLIPANRRRERVHFFGMVLLGPSGAHPSRPRANPRRSTPTRCGGSVAGGYPYRVPFLPGACGRCQRAQTGAAGRPAVSQSIQPCHRNLCH